MARHRNRLRLGRYEVLQRLAVGGSATVYLARTRSGRGFTREFALKVVHPHLDESLRMRFLEEARLSARVRHPNVVSSVEVGHDHGLDFLALELIDGLDLRRIMAERGRPLPPAHAAFILAAVARGAHALHIAVDEEGAAMGAVHRDLSPHNIMLDRGGRPVLIDLGLAKAPGRTELTEVGVLCGKLPYMSPEQALLQPLDRRSDVFALGTVLFELMTGSLPFGDDDSRGTLDRLLACDAAPLVQAMDTAGVPPAFAALVLVCLQAAPERRFGSALEVAEALEQELRRLGADQGMLQRQLAELVRETQDAAQGSGGSLGLAHAAVLPTVRRPWPAARWVGLGGVLSLGLLALLWFGAGRELGSVQPRDPDLLASDVVHPPAAEVFESHDKDLQSPTLRFVPVPMPVTTPAGDAALAGAETPPHRPRQARPRRRPLPLKPNPYGP